MGVRWQSKMLTGCIAPDNLLKGICCNCKEGERQCQTMKCSYWHVMCGVCCGHYSNGADVVDVGSDEEEND